MHGPCSQETYGHKWRGQTCKYYVGPRMDLATGWSPRMRSKGSMGLPFGVGKSFTEEMTRGLPGSPVIKTPHAHCRGCGSNPAQEIRMPYVAHLGQIGKKKKEVTQPEPWRMFNWGQAKTGMALQVEGTAWAKAWRFRTFGACRISLSHVA